MIEIFDEAEVFDELMEYCDRDLDPEEALEDAVEHFRDELTGRFDQLIETMKEELLYELRK